MKDIRKKIMIPCLAALIGAVSLVPANAAQDTGSGTDTVIPAEAGEERVYCVGSVSKVYVTAAVMQLVDQGLVDLDAPVTDYIPDFTMADERYRDITVRMLMDHTSGIMGTYYHNMLQYADIDTEYCDGLLQSLSTQRLKANPGEYAAYCNDGFDLLRIVVERVTGMSYTDYVDQHIAGELGLSHTGTAISMYDREDAVPVYVNGLPHDYEYCMNLGSGGIYATASDVAEFGSVFWRGNNVLISTQLQDAMATPWNDEEYMDQNGLGWDYVESLQFEQQGVQVLGKGGDIGTMHAFLMVAPDNDISISVLSSGGSSMYNGFLAGQLMSVVLEEQGIEVDHLTPTEVEIASGLPEGYEMFEGFYSLGTTYGELTFDEDGTARMVSHGIDTSSETEYRYTTCGGFVEVDANGQIRSNRNILFFEESDDGHIYIRSEQFTEVPEIGEYVSRSYIAEKIEDNPVSDEAVAAWRQYEDVPLVLCNNAYSSASYDAPFAFVHVIDEVPGYVLVGFGAGTCLLKIVDSAHAVAFQTIPSSSNRDLMDITVGDDGVIYSTIGDNYLPLAAMPEFTSDITSVDLTSASPSWYRIADDMAYSMISIDRPSNSAVYVYNKYFEVIYSSHVTDASSQIDLPEGGFIVFVGESGDSVGIG